LFLEISYKRNSIEIANLIIKKIVTCKNPNLMYLKAMKNS